MKIFLSLLLASVAAAAPEAIRHRGVLAAHTPLFRPTVAGNHNYLTPGPYNNALHNHVGYGNIHNEYNAPALHGSGYNAPRVHSGEYGLNSGEYGHHSGEYGHHNDYNNVGQNTYGFKYEVEDPYHGASFGHVEEKDGYVTKGSYYVDLPDGRRQIVNYTADEYGYHPVITYEGEAHYDDHGHGHGHGGGYGAAIHTPVPTYH